MLLRLDVDFAEQPTVADYKAGANKRQMVMELDVETWKVRTQIYFRLLTLMMALQRAKEVFNITHSMIPTREKARTRLGDKWYG